MKSREVRVREIVNETECFWLKARKQQLYIALCKIAFLLSAYSLLTRIGYMTFERRKSFFQMLGEANKPGKKTNAKNIITIGAHQVVKPA